jgi:hypothetical protein
VFIIPDLPGELMGMILLEGLDAANSPSLDFVDWYSPAFDDYVIELVALLPQTNSVLLWLEFSTDGGVTWDTTAGHYRYIINYADDSNGPLRSGVPSAPNIVANGTLSNDANYGCSGTVGLTRPGDTSMYKLVKGQTIDLAASGDFAVFLFGGAYLQTAAINGIRLRFSSGNIVKGSARIYGLSK